MISACVQQGHKILKRGIKVNPKFGKRLSALLLSAVVAAGSVTSAGACTGMYIGSEESANGSTFVGRSEDIGKLYDKVFEVIPAADHADGDIYVGGDGFSMPYPSHTYRFTVMRDSVDAGDTMTDEDGNITAIAFGEAGMNEKGVAASATVSTANDSTLFESSSYNVWEWDSEQDQYVQVPKEGKGYDPMPEGGICEVSLNSVILMQAETARDGVEKLAAIIDKYGSGECNSITISDANEVWDFETLTGHQYVAVRMPKDKVSVNPNMVVMNEIDISDTENVVASPELISMPFKNNILVSSQSTETDVNKITKIDIQKTYGAKDFGDGQYSRYWQGVNYLNSELSSSVDIYRENADTVPAGPFNMLFDADRKIDTYEALRLLAYRGEGSKYDSNTTGKYAIGNDNQAECHVFEIRQNMPEALSIVQWQTMSRAEFSVYLPYYSNLLTDTSDIFKSEYLEWIDDIEEVIDDDDFPADTSAYWVYAAINDLCDNDRERYGVNVKKFWENYQKQLIAQQADVDTAMKQIYAYSPALAEQKATELGKAVSEEAFGYAKSILTELRAFIAEHGNDNEVFVPTVLSENKLPTYSINMEGVNGTGIPSSSHHHSSSSSFNSTTNATNPVSASKSDNGSVSVDKTSASKGSTVTVTVKAKDGYKLDKLTITDAKGKTVDVTDKGNGKFSFVMPEGKVTVTPIFVADNGGQTESKSYSDVKTGDWYADAVKYVTNKGLMNGTDDNQFSPNASTTRGMLMTVLARYAGEDTTGGATWYEKGMEWAKAKGVSDGTNPNANITREQLVTMMYRYAGSPKADGKLDSFSDSASVSSYAADAMQWAVANGIVNGSNGKLNPQDNATRAEVAAILMRFCEMSK